MRKNTGKPFNIMITNMYMTTEKKRIMRNHEFEEQSVS